ncbi:hypothetical protein ANN_13098 [Periplaneta americana]|uniref:Uncharacterized protein n=1 Tax=Periplaneta americana TaxID=6978 RepID=A0ABQ8TL11_PERAM|nr:hypothetical protein ANN_13098 [Periplaneta americana]
MSPRSYTESYPAFAHIELRENPGKNLNQLTCSNRESNQGHLVSWPDALAVTPQCSNPWNGANNAGKECHKTHRECLIWRDVPVNTGNRLGGKRVVSSCGRESANSEQRSTTVVTPNQNGPKMFYPFGDNGGGDDDDDDDDDDGASYIKSEAKAPSSRIRRAEPSDMYRPKLLLLASVMRYPGAIDAAAEIGSPHVTLLPDCYNALYSVWRRSCRTICVALAVMYDRVSVCVSVRVSVMYGISGGDDEAEEERRGNPVPARSLFLSNSTKGPPGLTSPFEGRITINSDICFLFISTAERFGI